ncbi:MAG: asparagine synthase (glutamine-hydrolyzing) [Bacteroidota bacterium]
MCGICGRLNFDSSNNVDPIELNRMADRLAHRGPDDQGFFFDGHIGLGHRRLSIIDLDNGKQPMISTDNNFVIVYNGEIYNYLELRQELLIKGYKFSSYSDTEVLLNMYIEYGEECLSRLNGMFAFVIYDKPKALLFGARDRLGIKPFYYYWDSEKFIFGSEIKAILAAEIKKIDVNFDAVQDYLALQYTLGEKTFYQGVKSLQPGNYFLVKEKKVIIQKYWDLNYEIDSYHTEDYFIDRILMLLEDSVRLRLRSDVPLGTHLSGGLDSSTVATITAHLLHGRVRTFTGAFSEGRDFDETEYARLVSQRENTEYFETRPTCEDFVKTFDDIMYYMDEPQAGPGVFPQYFVSKLASENVKVVLGGQGGDEIFGGYIRYLIAYLEQCIKGAIYENNEEGRFVVDINSIIVNLPYIRNYEPLLKKFWSSGLFEPMSHRYFALIQRMDDLNGLINQEIYDPKRKVFAEFLEIFESSNTASYFNKMTHFDIKTFLPSILHVEDRTSMAHSLESRLPMLDYRIVELVAGIPPTMKFKAGEPKYIFKRAVQNILPKEILERKDKKGFPVPLNLWYENGLNDYIQGLLCDGELIKRGIINQRNLNKALRVEQKFGRQLWGLLCLEVFFRNLKRMSAK